METDPRGPRRITYGMVAAAAAAPAAFRLTEYGCRGRKDRKLFAQAQWPDGGGETFFFLKAWWEKRVHNWEGHFAARARDR